jgi:hypothetical protein
VERMAIRILARRRGTAHPADAMLNHNILTSEYGRSDPPPRTTKETPMPSTTHRPPTATSARCRMRPDRPQIKPHKLCTTLACLRPSSRPPARPAAVTALEAAAITRASRPSEPADNPNRGPASCVGARAMTPFDPGFTRPLVVRCLAGAVQIGVNRCARIILV